MLSGEAIDVTMTLRDRLREQFRDSKNAVAIQCREETLTYGELGTIAETNAQHLKSIDNLGAIVIRAERTIPSIVQMLSAVLAGVPFIPIDPEYAPTRISKILESLSTKHESHNLDAKQIVIDKRELRLQWPDDTYYVMFTSGTSGTPKPVAVTGDSLSNYCAWAANEFYQYGIGAPLFSSLGFDHSVTLLWPPLMVGKRVVLCPNSILDMPGVVRAMTEQFSLLKLTPTHFQLLNRLLEGSYSKITRVLMFGGELLNTSLILRNRDRLVGTRLINHYGPTECTVGCVAFDFDIDYEGLIAGAFVPIGLPIWNTSARLSKASATDGSRTLVIEGAQVAAVGRGLKAVGDRTLLTRPPEYDTGDICSINPNGYLCVAGRRNDTQLKVNGVRMDRRDIGRIVRAAPWVVDHSVEVIEGAVQQLTITCVTAEESVSQHDADQLKMDLRQNLASFIGAPIIKFIHGPEANIHGKRV